MPFFKYTSSLANADMQRRCNFSFSSDKRWNTRSNCRSDNWKQYRNFSNSSFFIDNAINLIDGIDGLAASLSLLALAGFLAYFKYHGVYVYTYTIIVAGMMGALVAFAQ